MIKKIKNKKIEIISALLSILVVVWTFISDKYIFTKQSSLKEIPYQNWMFFVKLLIFILMFYIFKLIFKKKIKNLKFMLAYFGIMLIFYILVYPGIWRWDDIIIFGSLTDGNLYFWQHWLSSAYYYFCMNFIPTASGIILIQILIISIFVGHIIGNEYEKHGKKSFWIFLTFLLPAVIDSNLYPMRSNICAYIELFLFYEIITIDKENLKVYKLLIYTFLVVLLSVWRPENIVYLIMYPIILLITKKVNYKEICIAIVVGLCLFVPLNNKQKEGLNMSPWTSSTGKIMNGNDVYEFSGIISPLEVLVDTAYKKGEFTKELNDINKMFPIKDLINDGSIGLLWGGKLKSLTPKQLANLKKYTIKMGLSYIPELFMQRLELYMWSNGFKKDAQIFLHSSAHIYDSDKQKLPDDIAKVYEEFGQRYLLNKPINSSIRKIVVSHLEMKSIEDYVSGNQNLSIIFYNSSISIILTIIVAICCLINKKWDVALLILALAIKFGIVFLTIPMSAFMYYFSTYLICTFISMYFIVFYVLKNRIKNK